MKAAGPLILSLVVLLVVVPLPSALGRTGLQSDIANDFRTTPRPTAANPGDQTLYFTQVCNLTRKCCTNELQLVDHFDPLNKATYQQKYIVNKDNWVKGGPIFRKYHTAYDDFNCAIVFLGGEAPLEVFEFQEVYPRLLTKTFGTN